MSSESLGRAERWTIAVIAAASVALRAAAYFRYRFDSDEPQHLHVTWGWTAGLVQYRDLFDNHAPLFHMATAPILALLGERADILLYMRAPMVVLWAAVLLVTFRTASALWSARVALWSVVLLACFPPFFLKSLEYRTDNAWTFLCVAAVALHLQPSTRHDRGERKATWFGTGLLLGLALTVSVKTAAVVAALVLTEAAAGTSRISRNRLAAASAAAAGFAIPPALIATLFAALGAWSQLVYCVFTFNTLVNATHSRTSEPWLYAIGVALLVVSARRVRARITETPQASARLRLAAFVGAFVLTVVTLLPLVSARDFLAVIPWAVVLGVAAIDRFARSTSGVLLPALAALFLAAVFHYSDRLENRTDEHITMMNQVLRLTRPGEPLMDFKGETIYRHRPFYFIFEKITRQAMVRGLIRDTVADDLVRAHCHVVQADGAFFPPRSREFLLRHYISLGRLRASGQRIADDGSFSIAIPGRYVVVSPRGEAAGLLDGTPYGGAKELTAGTHRFEPVVHEPLAVLWAPAHERGFSPFHPQDISF